MSHSCPRPTASKFSARSPPPTPKFSARPRWHSSRSSRAQFEPRRRELLARARSARPNSTPEELPDFLPETQRIRESDWNVAPVPADLQDRRVEITGPTDRKMVINALNSGANVFMADFEDSNTPTWSNMIEGQINLRDAVNRGRSSSRATKASPTA